MAAIVASSPLLVAGCTARTEPALMASQVPRSAASPSFVEIARAEPPAGHRVLLVAFPRTACSGSARTVFMDEKGTFFGALAPGEATLLVVPVRLRTILAVPSVEITAPTRTRFAFDEIEVPAAPEGLLLESTSVNARQCGRTGQYAGATIASKREIETRLADVEIAWLEPRMREGQAWLDEHGARLDELLGRRPVPRPKVIHHSGIP